MPNKRGSEYYRRPNDARAACLSRSYTVWCHRTLAGGGGTPRVEQLLSLCRKEEKPCRTSQRRYQRGRAVWNGDGLLAETNERLGESTPPLPVPTPSHCQPCFTVTGGERCRLPCGKSSALLDADEVSFCLLATPRLRNDKVHLTKFNPTAYMNLGWPDLNPDIREMDMPQPQRGVKDSGRFLCFRDR